MIYLSQVLLSTDFFERRLNFGAVFENFVVILLFGIKNISYNSTYFSYKTKTRFYHYVKCYSFAKKNTEQNIIIGCKVVIFFLI